MSTHSNQWSTQPENRYKKGKQAYHWDTPRSITVVSNSDNRFMNRIPGLEISAGMVLLNGIPVTVDGTLSVPQVYAVTHMPGDAPRGLIELHTENSI